jgi:hypothetical protein
MVSTFLDVEISVGVKTNSQKPGLSKKVEAHPEGQQLPLAAVAQHALAIPRLRRLPACI